MEKNIVSEGSIKELIRRIKSEIVDRFIPRSYPIGYLKILASVEPAVMLHDIVWLRCDGRAINIEDFPNVVGLGGVRPPESVFQEATVQMTSNTQPDTHRVSSSSMFSPSYDAYRAFGREARPQTMDAWVTGMNTYNTTTGNANNGSGEYIEVELPEQTLITRYAFKSRNADLSIGESSVRDFQLIASNDRANWFIVDSRMNAPRAVVPRQSIEINISPERPYKYWRLIIPRITIGSRSRGHVGVSEFYLFKVADLPSRVILPNIELNDGMATYINTGQIGSYGQEGR